jgi:integrase
MGPKDVEDGGINVTQQKTGKELWVPLHDDLGGALDSWTGSSYVHTPKGTPYTSETFRAARTRLMNETPRQD